MTPEERKSANNGVWLCATCHALVDRDEVNYSVELLEGWKRSAEAAAGLRLEYPDIYEKLPRFRYFTKLSEYLEGPQSQHVEEDYFQRELIYFPEEYMSAMREVLQKNRRCLLVGNAGAGKTTLAVAFGRRLQRTEGYSVLYTDVARAYTRDGRNWCQIILADDREYVLYVFDNCHLAPEEVNEFCFQLDGLPLKQVQVVMISRPETRRMRAEFGEASYFEVLSSVTLAVDSTRIWPGVLQSGSTAYQRQAPGKYVPLEDDEQQRLEEQHAHNLAVSRIYLETWQGIGGRLSDVTSEKVYEHLSEKYLIRATNSLPVLCVLWQYEIPAHTRFVDQLDSEELSWLEAQGLMTSSQEPGYGQVYYPLFHSEQARMILEASVYRKQGYADANRVGAETLSLLGRYLRVAPPNYERVYGGLYRDEQYALENQLLADRDLQNCAVSQFETGRIPDTILYLYALSSVDPPRAHELLGELVKTLGARGIRSRMLEHTLWDMQFSLHFLQRLDENLTREILTGEYIEELANKAKAESASLVGLCWLTRTLSGISPEYAKILLEGIPIQSLAAQASASAIVWTRNILQHLQRLDYPQLSEFVESMDMEQLARQVAAGSFQSFFWLVRTVKVISPQQAKTLFANIPVQGLAAQASASDISSVARILRHLQQLDYPQLSKFVESMDMKQLARQVAAQSFQSFMWLVRTVTEVSPQQAKTLLANIPVQGLAAQASASDIGSVEGILRHLQRLDYPQLSEFVESMDMEQLAAQATTQARTGRLQRIYWLTRELRSISPSVADSFLGALTPAGLASLFRSREGTAHELGNLCRVMSEAFRMQFLRQFSSQDIVEVFARSPLGQVGTFTQHYYRHFADHYALFREQFLAEKLATEPLDEIGKFIHRIGQVQCTEGDLACEALDLLVDTDLAKRVTDADDLAGIGRLINAVVEVGEQYSKGIRQALHTANLTNKLAAIDADSLAHFLWQVFEHIDEKLAYKYCGLVDVPQSPEQLGEAPLDALCHLLWNLVQISDPHKPQILRSPIVRERLVAAWDSNIGLGANLLGIVSAAQPEICEDLQLPPVETQVQRERLADWLIQSVEEKQPYTLALTVRGLRTYDESVARSLAWRALPLLDASQLVQDAIDGAITAPAMTLLQEADQWFSMALFEETIEQLDRLHETAEQLLDSPAILDLGETEDTR